MTEFLLFCAVAGLVCCTGYLVLVVISAIRFRRRPQLNDAASSELPPVSLLKPLCGLEPELELNLRSFFQQDYPRFELVFGVRQLDDPALKLVRKLQRRYPKVSVTVVRSGEPDRANAKVCSLEIMCAAARYDYLVISDSDVRVDAGYVRAVVRPLLDPAVGLVTCLYRGLPTNGMWSRLEALGMSVEMTSGVLVADLLEGMRFALGPTMAIRRDTLEAVGGIGVLADYCADDFVLGQKVHELGWKVVLSDHVVNHVVINESFRTSVLHQVRWMRSTRFSRGLAHVGTGLTFAMPFGLLGLAAGFAAGAPFTGVALFAWAMLNRIILALVAGWLVVRDRRSLAECWLYPVRGFLGFCYWCASFAGREVVWRGERYRLEAGGLMVRTTAAADAREPVSVPADTLV